MVVSRLRILIALLVVALAGTLAAPAASPAKGRHKLPHRVGGKVHKAWPAKHVRGKRAKHPRKALSRFLAKQVGPTKLKVEKPKLMAARTSSAGPLVTFLPAATSTKLRLVRSFDVPADDPAAARMTNLSWTYDSAIAAIALISQNEKTQAEQLLDQLAALQRTDGSIDFAYNVSDGSSLPVFNTGAIAWTGVAAAMYRSTYDSNKYDALAGGTTKWLLNRRNSAGLLTGTPSATWVSTQHNIIAWYLMQIVTDRLPSGVSSSTVVSARNALGTAIKRDLLVNVNSTQMAFNQGAGDPTRALDAQVLGTLFLAYDGALGNNSQASSQMSKVLAYIDSAFPVSGRSVVKSTGLTTYNNTWAAAGPFSGYRPYATGTGPDVLSGESTAQVRYMWREFGVTPSALDSQVNAWNAITSGKGYGPLAADRTASTPGLEYHAWPAAATASWELLGGSTVNRTPF
jgi:hypothetical protein